MIRTLKRKFIVTAMTAVTVLLVTMLGAVNAVNVWTTRQDTARQLEDLLRMELQGPPALPQKDGAEERSQTEPPAPHKPGVEEQPSRGFMGEAFNENSRLSAVYFTVWIRDGAVTRTLVDRISDVSDGEAAALGLQALAAGRPEGRMDKFRYASGQTDAGETLYVFLEDSGRRNAVLRVIVLSGLAGLGGWLLMLGLVVLLSKKAIAPIAENMARQRRFVTDAGHELKTPLAIIRANAEAMELISGETKWSRNIKAQTERLTELTRNLLTLARSDESPAPESLTPVDFSALAERSAQMFQASMERRGLTLDSAVTPGLTVRGDAGQLGTLCSILLDNAVNYAAPDSRLKLELRRQDKSCLLRLENDCDALPDCPPEQLFDRFYRADAARTQGSGGFGIGLSAAQVIAQHHRGRLSAEYLSGSRIAFTFSLPAAAQPPKAD